MSDSIKQLTVQLKELPKSLEVLPGNVIDQLITSHELLKGMIKLLPEYTSHTALILDKLNSQISKINSIINLFNDYDQTSFYIEELISDITKVYEEFSSLELIQYKLLSSNFNQSLLKSKYKKLVGMNDEESRSYIKAIDSSNLESSLDKFRKSRKLYHLRQEKLNRWNEDRVSGVI